jgi:DeoR family transcriptional regulator, suf operon transcriptional repressor
MMKSTRDKVLQTLVAHPRSTIKEIAESVGINAISVRHHLTNLQAEGLISAEEERHGVGRPRLVYFLTDSGQEQFPKRYFQLSQHLISQLKKSMNNEAVGQLFKNMAIDITNEHRDEIQKMAMDERLALLEEIMSNEGYDLKLEKVDSGYEILEVACPFYKLGKDHPEICLFDRTLIASVLAVPLSSVTRIKHGDNHCSFKINNETERNE